MATVTANARVDHEGGTFMHSWEALGNADVGSSIKHPGSADRTVQVIGTFGGATVVLQGSLDGATWFTCSDLAGNAISFTAAGGEAVAENCLFYRPSTSGGTGTDVDVSLFSRSTR